MDGLLVDSERVIRDLFLELCLDAGWPVPVEVFNRSIGTNEAATRRMLVEALGTGFPFDRLKDAWLDGYAQILASNGVPLKPGAHELLTGFRDAGIPVAVVTSTNRGMAEQLLERVGLRSLVRVMVCGGETQAGKPAPNPYRVAQIRMEADATRCWAFEDSNPGVRSAHAAGLATIQVPDLIEPADDVLALGHTVIGSLNDAVDWLSTHNSR